MDLSFSTNTAVYAFGAYDQICLEGIEYVPHSQNECGHLFTRADGTGLAKQVSHGELSRLAATGRLIVKRNHYDPSVTRKRIMEAETSLAALQGKPKVRMNKREAYCQAAIDMRREGMLKFTDESLKANMYAIMGRAIELAENLNPTGAKQLSVSENFGEPPAPRTLRRWLSACKEFGLHGLVDNMSRRGNRTTSMSPEALGLMMKQVREYLSAEKPSIKMIHENVQESFRERNEERAGRGLDPLITPSRETVRRAIRTIDPFTVEAARNGEAAARKKFRPVAGGIEVTRPLERVEIDEWTVDVMTLMESSGMFALLTDEEKALLGLEKKKKDRWTLTAAICCTTRCIVGMVLSRNPKAQAAVQVLQMITTDKGAWADAVGALSPWDMHGTPELIVFDGGAAFKSQRFRFAAEDMVSLGRWP